MLKDTSMPDFSPQFSSTQEFLEKGLLLNTKELNIEILGKGKIPHNFLDSKWEQAQNY